MIEEELEELEYCPYCGCTLVNPCDRVPYNVCDKAIEHTYLKEFNDSFHETIDT